MAEHDIKITDISDEALEEQIELASDDLDNVQGRLAHLYGEKERRAKERRENATIKVGDIEKLILKWKKEGDALWEKASTSGTGPGYTKDPSYTIPRDKYHIIKGCINELKALLPTEESNA
jgi:hypothetical protein